MTRDIPASSGRKRDALRHRGYTLLEVLTVVGIIAALASIVAIAFNVVGKNAKLRQTRANMEICLTLQGDYTNTSTLSANLKTAAVNATLLTTDTSPAIDPTAQMAALFQKLGSTKQVLGQLSSDQIDSITWVPAAWISNQQYYKDDFVTDGSLTYKALAKVKSTSAPNVDTANWAASTVPATLVVPRDAWGKGMRFAGALDGVDVADQVNQTIRNKTGQPFWVSAGPDGLFNKGDDNIYSFEN